MTVRCLLTALVLSLSLTALLPAQKPASKGKGKAKPTAELKPEPLKLKPGEPLSVRALVARPPLLKGVASWTIETRQHRSYVSATALSPDGTLYATGGIDGTIRIWEPESAKLVRALVGHDSYCYGLAFSPDGKLLASAGSFDRTVRIWDVKSGMPLRALQGHPTYVVQVAWSPDGAQVAAAGGESGVCSYWDVASGKHLGKTDLGRHVRGISWHPEGKRIAIAAPLLAVSIWEVDQDKVVESFGDANAEFQSVAWSADGKTLAAGGGNYVFLYDQTGKELKKLAGQGHALAWSRDGKTLASSAASAAKINLWNSETGSAIKKLDITAYTVAFMPGDQKLIASGSYAYSVIDIAASKAVGTHQIGGTAPPLWWNHRPLVTGVGSAKLSLWDSSSGKLLRVLEGHKAAIAAVTYSPDGKRIATASHDKTVKLWDASAGKETHTLEGHSAAVLAVAFSSDGKLVASGGQGKLVLVHDANTGLLVQTHKGHNDRITALAWTPGNSGMLVSGSSDRTAKIWKPKIGPNEVRTLTEDAAAVVSAGWSPDGKIVITGHDDHRARTWQASSGKLLHTLEVAGSPPQVSSLAWSPNNLILACGRGNHTLQLWNTRTAKLIHSLQAMAPVERVSWSPGSSTVISSNADRTTRFFDAASGRIRATLVAEDKQIVAIGGDGHYRSDGNLAGELVVVAQLAKSQDTFSPAEFSSKFHFKNVPGRVVLSGK